MMSTEIRTDATETSAEALQALERVTAPRPPPVDPAVAEQQRAVIRVVEALLREHAWLAEVEAWVATRPTHSVTAALGMALGEPQAECSRPIRLLNGVMYGTQALLRAPRRARLQRIAADLAAAVDLDAIEALQAEAKQVAVQLSQARAAVEPWRANVRAVEDAARETVAALQAWLADCERAREGSA
jgi:hypothetical protein